MRAALLVLPMLLLAACGRHHQADAAAVGGAAPAAPAPNSVAIDVPGFKAQVALPSSDLGGRDTDIDGLRLYPGTRLTGMNIAGQDRTGGVTMSFTAAAAPAAVLAYYRDAAPRAGFTLAPAAADAVSATKGARTRVDVVAHPVAGGSAGTVSVSDD